MGQGTPLAGVRGERLLAVVAVAFRLGCVLLLVTAPAVGSASPCRPAVLWVMVALGSAETLVFAAACWRGRRVRIGWVLVDLTTLTLLLALPSLPVLSSGRTELSPFYNFALIASVVAGIAPWPVWAALASTAPLIAATIAAALPPDSGYPLWNAVPDGLSFPSTVFVAWVVSQLIRHAHREHDRHRAAAARRAGLLAKERERGRQAAALRARLLSTLEEMDGDTTLGPVLVAQLRRELDWLREVVDRGLPEPADDPSDGPSDGLRDGLRDGLSELAAEKEAAGLLVALILPDREPVLPARTREALLGATREALTNVAKHAGVTAAAVTLTLGQAAVAVEIRDRGRGYRTGQVAEGVGQAGAIRGRLAEVGGSASVRSTPGTGTRVLLRVPERPR
jgi:hypothetical protein